MNKLNPNTSVLTRYSKEEGLDVKNVSILLTDDLDRLWISSEHGLIRFDPESAESTLFTVYDGLQNNRFNGGSCYKNAKGEMYASSLAKQIDCTYSHVVKILQEMQKEGLINFEKQGRLKLLTLTKSGIEIAEHIDKIRNIL